MYDDDADDDDDDDGDDDADDDDDDDDDDGSGYCNGDGDAVGKFCVLSDPVWFCEHLR